MEGLVPYFILVTLTYSAIVSYSSNMKLIALISGFYLVALNVIPTLKYVFVYGYHDPLDHFGSIQQTIAAGHMSEVGVYSEQYGAAPGLHLLVSELSMVTGSNALFAFKLFLVVSPFILPLVVYLVMKRLDAPNGLVKAALFASVITAPVTYIYTGTTSVYPLYEMFICFCLLFFSFGPRSRSEFVTAFVIGVGIVVSHDSTSFFLLVIVSSTMLFIILARRIGIFKRIPNLSILFAMSFGTLVLAHFTFTSSTGNLTRLLSLMDQMIVRTLFGHQLAAVSYYQGFFSLGLIDRIKIFLITYGNVAILLLLVAAAPFALYKLRRANVKLRGFYYNMIFPALLAFLSFALYLFVSGAPDRGLIYFAAFAPFLAGLTIYYLFFSRRYRFDNLVVTIVVFSLICACVLSTFPVQPLMPTVSTTQGSYYAYDLRQVNTVYDRSLVLFVSAHNSSLSIWTDDILRDLTLALTNSDFQSLLTSNPEKAALLLLSVSHAIPSGRNAFSNEQYIQNASLQDDILYSNGLSFAMLNTSNTAFP
ncbi:MAG: hypothetical protein ABSB28_01705 [Candidatus Bathyarchaeia archaeon]